MNSLTVLSPHQDDAALSLGMTIRAAARTGNRVRVVNCFTVSSYAPHLGLSDPAAVGMARRKEDREFAARVGTSVEIIDLGMEDAPIRLGCTVDAVRRRKMDPREHENAARIADAVGGEGIVLAPLGLGGHIDHLVAREAGIRLARAGRPVGFYEDLPYAASLRDCCIVRAADGAGKRLNCLSMRDREAAARKRFAIEVYASQLSAEQFDSVMEYGERRGGERLWLTQGHDGLVSAPLERTGIEAGSFLAVWRRRIACAAHYAANRAQAVQRRAAQLTVRGGGVNAPQEN